MTKNQLPEGVGKKIVEALKRQSEIEINPIEDVEEIEIEQESLEETLPESFEHSEDIVTEEFDNNIFAPEADSQDDFIIEEPIEEPEVPQFSFTSEPITLTPQASYNIPEEDKMPNIETQKSFDIPANVAVLKKLITQLPTGVTKQTGAQIIRQTIEALGISMNNVLQEAQQVQDGLNSSIKDCMTKVQEYKTNIMHLERHAQDYQRQVSQINDLISLFILTDKTK